MVLDDASLKDSSLTNSNLFYTELTNANLAQTELDSSTLNNANFSGVNLSGVSFNFSTLNRVKFTDSFVDEGTTIVAEYSRFNGSDDEFADDSFDQVAWLTASLNTLSLMTSRW